jgi:hypothetical protein
MTNIPPKLDNKTLDKKLAELLAFQRKTVSGVVGTGRVLTEVKEQLDHGEFTAWLKDNCGWSHATTLRYRRSFDWANTIDDFENLNLTIMALYYCAEKHAIASQHADEYNTDCKAGLTAVVTAARMRLIDNDEAESIYLKAFFESDTSNDGNDDVEIDETIEEDDDDSAFIADDEEGDEEVTDIIGDVTPTAPPLRYIHTTHDGERTEYLPASPLHLQSALHMILATHADTSDAEWLEQIEDNPVDFYKLLDHMIDLRSKREASNSPIKTKADRAEAKAKNGKH